MKLLIPFLGKTKESYLEQGIRDYADRLGRYLPVEIKVLKEQGRHEPDQVMMVREAEEIQPGGIPRVGLGRRVRAVRDRWNDCADGRSRHCSLLMRVP